MKGSARKSYAFPDFLSPSERDEIIALLGKYYNVNPTTYQVYLAVQNDSKSRKISQRDTVNKVLKEIGYLNENPKSKCNNKYLPEDSKNPIDQEISKCIKEKRRKRNGSFISEDIICRRILLKRLAYNQYTMSHSLGIERLEEIIEISIMKKVKRTGMTREEVIREAFCLHFNIKT